ncbi:MAG: hypothetical protein L0387_18520, partial [Acidobacteria bacterium]|nr:hypothetical protein [Acidobacteriota bacterium]
SASETLVWLRLYTDRAHNNRKAVRKTGKNVQSPDSRFRGNDELKPNRCRFMGRSDSSGFRYDWF